jgi:hypothetical protein
MNLPKNTVRARQICHADIPAVVNLLAAGFKDHSSQFWRQALMLLTDHPTPAGLPKYGYLLESNGAVVGAILLIFSKLGSGNAAAIRCSVSSWFVEPSFRSYATLLASKALSHKNVTYLNITPAIHTLPIIQVQGFSQYSKGIFLALPALQLRFPRARVMLAAPDRRPSAQFEPFERELLSEHAKCGCLSLWCETAERAYPFVFRPRTHKGILPYVQLIYSRHLDAFVRLAGPLGRFLLVRGWPLVMIDANGPMPGLVGKYRDAKQPKYFKGPERPRLGDLAYTEVAMFGV